MKHILAILMLAVGLSASAFRTDTISVASNYLPEAMKVTVIVPDQASAADPAPTVYLLNGYGGDYTSWGIVNRDLGNFADLYGMVMVMPSGMDSWYWDTPGLEMESFITKVLVPTIDKKYPTINDRSKRAITGLSMGGHGAFYLAARHPELFGNIGSTSGGVNIIPFPNRWKMANLLGSYEGNEQVWKDHTAASYIPQLQEGEFNIIFDCGVDDFFAGVNNDFHNELVKAGVAHDYISRPGAHTRAYWENAIPYQLWFFNRAFSK